MRDLRLVEAFRLGHLRSIDELLLAYDPCVRETLVELGVSPADLDGLTQDVISRVSRNLHTFQGQSSFSVWLYRITVNVRFAAARKRRRADARRGRASAYDTAVPSERGADRSPDLQDVAT